MFYGDKERLTAVLHFCSLQHQLTVSFISVFLNHIFLPACFRFCLVLLNCINSNLQKHFYLSLHAFEFYCYVQEAQKLHCLASELCWNLLSQKRSFRFSDKNFLNCILLFVCASFLVCFINSKYASVVEKGT